MAQIAEAFAHFGPQVFKATFNIADPNLHSINTFGEIIMAFTDQSRQLLEWLCSGLMLLPASIAEFAQKFLGDLGEKQAESCETTSIPNRAFPFVVCLLLATRR